MKKKTPTPQQAGLPQQTITITRKAIEAIFRTSQPRSVLSVYIFLLSHIQWINPTYGPEESQIMKACHLDMDQVADIMTILIDIGLLQLFCNKLSLDDEETKLAWLPVAL